ncbi:type IV toxin-antitoxin system AbiEi family antitoxin domain-containing protein [Paenibacillus sabinae]|uniref:Transcriptional regulator, AbiEi antitoxin, Type IV TA system n=1 Tax=Paenibacillus sabinae T27 TaxID=1268072 RepID=X4ZCA5_9BACL|nr:type IV toxin-antitoxin system AbiEi family antitoxin domain-containing protein [Paenibacillus sabinae]AHV95152.1 hypothetical protein PSAB_01060 [Paenibacillus sabinae T27]
MGDLDFDYIKKGFLNVFKQLGVHEEEFFNLVRRYPNIHKLDDLIAAIKTEDESKKEAAIYPEIIELFRKYNGIVNANILKENQINYYQLNKLESMGKIIKLKRGLYALKDINYMVDEIVEAALLIPKGVLCLYSALAHHELTTYTPSEYNFAVSRKERKPTLPDYPPIRIFTYDDDTFDIGIEKIEKDGHSIKVYDLERTICDTVKYRNKLDANVVKESLNNYSNSRKRNYIQLFKYAERLRVKSILNNYLEVL